MLVDGETYWVVGAFRELDRPARLVIEFGWEGQPGPRTIVTIDLQSLEDSRTELRLTHDLEGNVNACVEGWEDRLVELERFFG